MSFFDERILTMNALSELMGSLKGSFRWNKARLFCLAGILLALIRVRTVNLREIELYGTTLYVAGSRSENGLDFIRETLFQLYHKAQQFKQCLSLISIQNQTPQETL